jgi:hypothetical protein
LFLKIYGWSVKTDIFLPYAKNNLRRVGVEQMVSPSPLDRCKSNNGSFILKKDMKKPQKNLLI